MDKQAFFFIDDVIWVFRDLARKKPSSIFDNEYFKMLKRAHDDHGLTVQLNLFYRTDYFYGTDEFTLAEMPDIYKPEFEANADWLRFSFHAKQEFPDYPHVNATYDDVKKDYLAIFNEVKRFAGEKSWALGIIPHWIPMSKAGCQALADCGAKYITTTIGKKTEFTGDDSVLPYGHAARLKNNRQPETGLFTRDTKDTAIRSSIAAYNHMDDEQYKPLKTRNASILDKETGIRFHKINNGFCINLNTQSEILEKMQELNGNEYIAVSNHEQYFYEDYFNYIPDYADRIYLMAKTFHKFGYRFITADELK